MAVGDLLVQDRVMSDLVPVDLDYELERYISCFNGHNTTHILEILLAQDSKQESSHRVVVVVGRHDECSTEVVVR